MILQIVLQIAVPLSLGSHVVIAVASREANESTKGVYIPSTNWGRGSQSCCNNATIRSQTSKN